jgi:hypothetical protein
VDTSNVLEMSRPFDPLGAEAETQYDTVVRRINRVRARRTCIEREQRELERQFIDGDFTIASGRRCGEPLPRTTRHKRLMRLLELSAQAHRLTEEERFALRALNRMDLALDRWARDTYGP